MGLPELQNYRDDTISGQAAISSQEVTIIHSTSKKREPSLAAILTCKPSLVVLCAFGSKIPVETVK
jgi:hypothetical protein